MSKGEIIFGGVTVIGSYVLLVVLLMIFRLEGLSFLPLCAANVALIVYYLRQMSLKNSPTFVDKTMRFIISVDIFYLFCCALCCVLCCTYKILPFSLLSLYGLFKILLRIGCVVFLLVSVFSFVYYLVNYLGKGDKTHNPFKTHLRQILIFFTNIVLVPFATYSYSYASSDGRFIETIVDGPETTYTFYDDSLQNYVTYKHLFIDENGFNDSDYVIYYESYPNVISKIDTLP